MKSQPSAGILIKIAVCIFIRLHFTVWCVLLYHQTTVQTVTNFLFELRHPLIYFESYFLDVFGLIMELFSLFYTIFNYIFQTN